jgi:two-component system phosphate regulon response regulator PhoB
MAREKILVVEDEEDILDLIAYHLQKEGYVALKATTGEAALERLPAGRPDLVILDLMLPGMDGLEVCRRMKADPQTREIPIVMVTARGEEADVVSGLEMGAADYLSKPFRPRELIARVRAVLRRGGGAVPDAKESILLHDILIDPRRREVRVQGRRVELTHTEFEILHFLARRPGWVFSRYQIVDAVRGDNYPVTDRSVDVQIVGLRRKLGRAARHIETVRGSGYRMQDPQH